MLAMEAVEIFMSHPQKEETVILIAGEMKLNIISEIL
jgi:hypothetical protein